jgi:hypothetical protein
VKETKSDSTDGDRPDDIVNRLVQVAENRFAAHDREAAQDLLRGGFGLLPLELQYLYFDMLDLYHEGRREEAAELFDEWLAQARELGLI